MTIAVLLAGLAAGAACERVDHSGDFPAPVPEVELDEVARILSAIPLGTAQLEEVYDAVSASSENGYDEEYTMRDLFADPGAGVGDAETKATGLYTKAAKTYEQPLKELIADYVHKTRTKAGNLSPEEYLAALSRSDVQIYWPYSERWSGRGWPVITYDPADGSSRNMGYRLVEKEDGTRSVEEVLVDEAMALEEPVWVVNRNDDSAYRSLELQRRLDPNWGNGGGNIIPGPVKADEELPFMTLLLKDFKANRNFDPWFNGASEFFVKAAAVEDFFATTEAELQLYSPSITDFMVVVKRDQVGQVRPFNAVLVSQWTEQLGTCAFMITEDDGGSITTWKCSAEVKIKSKAYGFDIAIPFNSRDDIVWRGQLSSRYFSKYSGETGHFGDVELTFETVMH